VENAAASKPQIDRFITRFARIYTPIVVAAAAMTALIPSLITGNWGYWVYTALSFLVMSCPCALVLSVPLAFFSGIGVGSKKGILFKGGASIEAMAKLNCVALDKTGTVTKGDFAVQQVMGGDEILALCAACERFSTHPIAVSILRAAREKDLTIAVPESIEELSGRGIRGVVGGKTVLCGNRQLMAENGLTVEEISGTVVYVAVDHKAAGFITIADTLKSGVAQAISQLHDLGIATAMLTGDSRETAHAVAKATGIQAVHAKLLPHEKLDTLRSIRTAKGSTMFVGDGINDAPVLAGADVGGAMGSGADAAIEAADVVYMTSDIQAVPDSISIARRTQAIAWQNVVFALAIKAAVMVLGLFGYASMWMAVFADSGVAMLCVLNSIRLLYRKH
jgi:Cd2+/Zn2+-exporting ATPase